MRKPNYRRKVLLSPGGGAERKIALEDISIPDLWHDYENLKKIADWLRDPVMNPTGSTIIEDRARLLERISDRVLEVWHLAIDLKKNLADDLPGSHVYGGDL